ncbi:MAG: hypothetical protein ACI9SQ_001485 [Rubritalea sp.]|jgi:hypothetical protein
MNERPSKRPPFWLLPNLLSLDAPLVAVVWMWILAKSMRVVYVDNHAYWLLAGAVWSIYVLDRILDVRRDQGPVEEMSARHRFHWKYWKILLPIVIGVVIYCGYSAFNIASAALLTAGISGVGMVFIYILARNFDKGEVAYAKNFIAAMTFSFGVAAPIVVESVQLEKGIYDLWFHFTSHSDADFFLALRHGIANFFLMTVSTLGIVFASSALPFLFGLLCFLNITAIDLWEKSRRSSLDEEKEACETLLGTGLLILAAYAVYLAAYKLSEYERPLCYVVMVATALLYLINKYRSNFYLDAQRVLADLAMILPLPLIWIFSESDTLSFMWSF